MKINEIAVSSVESQGENFIEYDTIIDKYDYIKLWHEYPDNSSYDKILGEELGYSQTYTISSAYILPFADNEKFFTLDKVGYVYDIHRFDKDGNEVESVATENSKIVLDLEYQKGGFKVKKVIYDNDYNDYKVKRYHGFALLAILIIDAIINSIRYFNRCVKSKRKRNKIRLLLPFILPLLIAVSIYFDFLIYAVTIGVLADKILATALLIYDKKKMQS